MDCPKLGTCGGEHPCRWHIGDRCVASPPQVFSDGTGGADRYQPWVSEEDTCGQWEPPEGRVCGTCESRITTRHCLLLVKRGYKGKWCERSEYDTCPAWTWIGRAVS